MNTTPLAVAGCCLQSTTPATFTLPDQIYGREWSVAVDTRDWPVGAQGPPIPAGGTVETIAKSVVVLRRGTDFAATVGDARARTRRRPASRRAIGRPDACRA